MTRPFISIREKTVKKEVSKRSDHRFIDKSLTFSHFYDIRQAPKVTLLDHLYELLYIFPDFAPVNHSLYFVKILTKTFH